MTTNYCKLILCSIGLSITLLLLSSHQDSETQDVPNNNRVSDISIISENVPDNHLKQDTTNNYNNSSISLNGIKETFINNTTTFKKCKRKSEGKVLSHIFKKNQIQRDNNSDHWDLYIPCGYNHVESELKKVPIQNINQKIFGISGCDSIVSKNRLWELLFNRYGREMAKTIMPETFLLKNPADMTLFKKRYNPHHIYILKKNIQNKKGLKLTQDLHEITNGLQEKYVVVQKYIKDVFLINQRKVNLRIYLLLVCYKGKTNAYLYSEGKCIYTNKDYNPEDIMDKESNITSFHLNQEIYNDNPFSFEELKIYLSSRDHDGNLLFKRIKQMMIRVYQAVKRDICNLGKLKNNVSFQLFGIDVIFDTHLHPYILEINKGPEMNPKNNIDKDMKTKLNEDMLSIIKILPPNSNTTNLFERLK